MKKLTSVRAHLRKGKPVRQHIRVYLLALKLGKERQILVFKHEKKREDAIKIIKRVAKDNPEFGYATSEA